MSVVGRIALILGNVEFDSIWESLLVNRISSWCVRIVFLVVFSCGAACQTRADDWPQWRGPQRDGVWRETGLLDRFPAKTISRKWSVPLGTGYCGPTVADGRVFVMDRVDEPVEQERVLCFDAQSGERLWTLTYDCTYVRVSYTAGPRASVTITGGKAYALGTMGDLHCLEAATGDVIWHRPLSKQYDIKMPIWGIAAAPLIHDGLVIVHIGANDGASVVAFDRQTGQERWRRLMTGPSIVLRSSSGGRESRFASCGRAIRSPACMPIMARCSGDCRSLLKRCRLVSLRPLWRETAFSFPHSTTDHSWWSWGLNPAMPASCGVLSDAASGKQQRCTA